MSEPDFISRSRVAILGLGLMGGSLALALKGHCQAVFACDPDPNTIDRALKLEAVDQISSRPEEILPHADLVILSAPIHAILNLIERLPDLHPGAATVLDLGSTKGQIVQKFQSLPPRFDPLGGHPMCGKEMGGLEHAEASIFKGATFAFTPLARTSKQARSIAEQLASVVGSRSLWLDADTHDRWVAATSHLPYLTAAALTLATPTEASPLVGSGYRSTTRVAATPASIMLDVLNTNRENILNSINRFRQQIDILEELVVNHDVKVLKITLEKSASLRKNLIGGQSG